MRIGALAADQSSSPERSPCKPLRQNPINLVTRLIEWLDVKFPAWIRSPQGQSRSTAEPPFGKSGPSPRLQHRDFHTEEVHGHREKLVEGHLGKSPPGLSVTSGSLYPNRQQASGSGYPVPQDLQCLRMSSVSGYPLCGTNSHPFGIIGKCKVALLSLWNNVEDPLPEKPGFAQNNSLVPQVLPQIFCLGCTLRRPTG